MVSYFKTQWWRLLIALICLALTIMYCIQDNELLAVAWTLSFIYWIIISNVDYNHQRIEWLEKKADKYDALCEEVSALYEANRIDREYMKLLEQKINQLKYDMEN